MSSVVRDVVDGDAGICGTLLAGWFARFAIFGKALDQVFALSPYAVFTRPWTLLTSGYYEMSLAAACVDACGLLYIGRTLEPIWGPKELTRFVVGVNVATATMSWFSMCLLYVFSGGDEFYLFARFAVFTASWRRSCSRFGRRRPRNRCSEKTRWVEVEVVGSETRCHRCARSEIST